MIYFVINLILAFVWAGLIGSFSLGSLTAGFIFGYLIMLVFSSGTDATNYLAKIPLFIGFALYYLREMVRANVQIAIDLLRVTPHFTPGFVKVPLDLKTDVEITLLANLVTMTPGTLTVDVSDDRSHLLVHGLYMQDPQAVGADIKKNLEQRIIKLLRPAHHVS